MSREIVNDLAYLAARLHGRRSRLAEADRLDQLCRQPNLRELGRAVYPETELPAVPDFHRRLTEDLLRELIGIRNHMKGRGTDLLAWMSVRFQVENIKVLLRGFLRRTAGEAAPAQLLSLPEGMGLDTPGLEAAQSLAEFAEALPAGAPRESLKQALETYRDQPRPFFLEGALDRGYFQELLFRAARLSSEDRDLIQPIVRQEVDAFHLLLVVRGKFQYRVAAGRLLPLHVWGSDISRKRFAAMLAAPALRAASRLAVRRAIDELPATHGAGDDAVTINPAIVEALTWKRFLRLSNHAFRRSHMGVAAVVGYVGIRRVEVANLITLSEGIVAGLAPETLRARLHPRIDWEEVYV